MLKQIFIKYRKLVLYAIIGCGCAVLDFSIYSLLIQLIALPYLYANIISVHCGVLTSFFLNRQFTFKVKNKTLLRLLSFYLIGMTGLLISSGLLFVFVEQLHLNALISKAITVIFVALIQFLCNSFVSFRRSNSSA
jgi:putative flippase GtrA